MIRITAEQIYVMRNSTGKPFTDLLDRLIRSSAATLGMSPSSVLDNPRTNYPDGGVDTQVTAQTTLGTLEYFRERSAWQYKAVALTDLTDAKVREEINGGSKTYVRELLQQDYGYRFCVAHDGPAVRKSEIKALLDEEIQTVKPGAPEAIVLFASEIVDWVNTFPAIAAEINGAAMTDFFHFKTWENQARSETATFVSTPESDVVFERIKGHLDWAQKPNTARLTISGDAGVGKTRTVFEAIAAIPEAFPLVLYTNDEEKAIDLARGAANYPLYTVLVADECHEPAAYQLATILKGVEHRVRLVTIDNALVESPKTELRLESLSLPLVEQIVTANFPNVDFSRRSRYCSLAEGYLRFAIFLCDNDALIVQQGHLGELMRDTRAYLNWLFRPGGAFAEADLTALKVISLVERCGVVGTIAGELEQLCSIKGLNADDVRQRLFRMQQSNGLVGRAGRYFYVTPTPVALSCFHSAWNEWAALDPRSFLDKFPKEMIPSFLSRMARAPEEVGKVVSAYFRDWELARGSDIFADVNDTDRFLLLVRAAPEAMVPRMRDLVLSSTSDQLKGTYRSGRRSLVVEANELAAFPQWFFYAEEILFALSQHETEPEIGNNASKTWAGLFAVMTHVATSFPERLNLLRKRLASADVHAKLLCINALESVLDDRGIHLVSSSPYGNRVAPDYWRPKTYGELYGFFGDALALLRELSLDADAKVRERAEESFVKSIRSLVFRGFAKQARIGAGEVPKQLRPVLRAELREFLLLNNSEHSPHNAEERAHRSASVDEWIADLASDSIHDQVVEEVGPDSWDHHLEQDAWERRLDEIAKRLLHHGQDFDQELEWLSGDKAKSSMELGIRMGRADFGLILLDRIVAACEKSRNPNLIRGYLAGVSEAMRAKLPADEATAVQLRLVEAVEHLWSKDAVFGFNVMTPSGDFVHSFQRALRGLKEKRLASGYLRVFVAWNGPRHTSPAEARTAAEHLLASAKDGDVDAASTGIEFMVFLMMRTDVEDKTEWLKLVFGDPNLNVVFGLLEEAVVNSRRTSHWFQQVFSRALPADPDRATKILVRMLQSESYELSEAASGLFVSVASVRPKLLMEELGSALLVADGAFRLSFRHIPITILPESVLIEWLEANGVRGARLLARHLPRPFIGANGPDLNAVTRYVLENFGKDDQVLSGWIAGMHSGSAFTGSIADHIEQRAASARQFLHFPIEAVRRWAQSEVLFSERNAQDFRLSEEERF